MRRLHVIFRLATIDFEASSFTGWPIEVGWMREGDTAPKSMLIKPHASWSMDEWDEKAGSVHGIAIETLEREGTDVLDVYDALLAELSGCVVVSDASEYDQWWLQRLCDAAGWPTPFDIDSPSIVLPGIATRAGIGVHVAVARYIAATHSNGVLIEHRAGPDAARLMQTLVNSVPKRMRRDPT
jgi:hypothetical protein